jgi:hypothetical protein
MNKTPMIFTPAENELLGQALDQIIASAKRGQNTAKNQQFKEVYLKHEMDLQKLKTKILGE